MRTNIGFTITVLWLAAWGIVIFEKWSEAMTMGLNEWGDFFAGIFAPIAFMWLIIGYFQQGQELSLNTRALDKQDEALRLQVDELNQSVQQQKELVKITQAELEMTQQSHVKQYDKEKLMAQPIFEVSEKSYQTNKGNIITYYVQLENIGHLIKNTELSHGGHSSYVSITPTSIGSWKSGSAKGFNFSFPSEREDDLYFELIFDYLDGLAEENCHTLYCFIPFNSTEIRVSDSPFN